MTRLPRVGRKRLALSMLCVLSVPLSTSACGFILVNGPPEGYAQMDYVSCTESNAGPIIDFIWAGLNGVGALAVAGDPDYWESEGYNSSTLIVSSLAWTAVSTAAGVVGLNKTKRCRAAKQEIAARQRPGMPVAPAGTVVVSVVIRPVIVDTLRAVGEQVQLAAAAYSSAGEPIPNKHFTWSSSNDAIASVSNFGLVTAHAAGEVVVAANTDNVVGTVRVVVALPPGQDRRMPWRIE